MISEVTALCEKENKMKKNLKQLIKAINNEDHAEIKNFLDLYRGVYAAKYLVTALLDPDCTVPLPTVKTLLEKALKKQ